MRFFIFIVCLAVLSTSPAVAGSSEPRSHPTPANSAAAGPARPEPRPVVLKPQELTGLIRSSVGLERVRLSNGTTMVDARGRFREFVVVSIDAQGVAHIGCLHSEQALRAVLEGRAQAARARFEER